MKVDPQQSALEQSPPVGDLVAEVNRARAEAQDLQVRLDVLNGQYRDLEAICSTQAGELVRLRKAEAARIKLQEERVKMTERLGWLQSQVNDHKSVSGTIRLALWQVRRLPGLLLGRK
jgi:hypothetical protein